MSFPFDMHIYVCRAFNYIHATSSHSSLLVVLAVFGTVPNKFLINFISVTPLKLWNMILWLKQFNHFHSHSNDMCVCPLVTCIILFALRILLHKMFKFSQNMSLLRCMPKTVVLVRLAAKCTKHKANRKGEAIHCLSW